MTSLEENAETGGNCEPNILHEFYSLNDSNIFTFFLACQQICLKRQL